MHSKSLLVVVYFLISVGTASAQDGLPWFVRGGLGAGASTVSARTGFEEPVSKGPAMLWDGAAGVFVTRRLALHASTFGSLAPGARPTSSCVDNCGPDRHQTFWAQTYGAGLTISPEHAMGRSPLRFYFSTSTGLAIVGARLLERELGVGRQTLLLQLC